MGSSVPNRADNRSKYYITNGGLGTDNQAIRNHDLGSRQGRAAMKRAVDAHAERTGKTSWAYTEFRPYDEKSQRTQYTKTVK
jgi:hypothetical protein